MKILAIHNILWSHYKARLFSEIHQTAQQEGFGFSVLQIALTERSRTKFQADLSIHQYPYSVLFPGETLENITFLPKTKALLAGILREKPTLVYVNGYYDPAYWVVLAYCRFAGIKVVSDFETTEQSRGRVWWKEIAKKVFLHNVTGIVCLGKSAGKYLIHLGIPAKKILSRKSVGIDNEALRELFEISLPTREARKEALGLRKYNFIFAGRFVPEKNLLRFLDAFQQVQKVHPNIKDFGIVLIGDGTEKAALQAKSADYVCFIEPCEWHEVPDRYALGDVVILPSVFEPFGLVVNEALVYGMPVLVSERCGCAEDLVQDGVNGYTVNPFDTEDIAQKIAKFMDAPERFEAMGAAGREMIKAWNPASIVSELVGAFKTAHRK